MASISPLPQLPHLHLRSRHSSPLTRLTGPSPHLHQRNPNSTHDPQLPDLLYPIRKGAQIQRPLLFHRHANQCFGESRSGRREALVRILLSTALLPSFAESSLAETDLQQEFRTYEDETNKFKIVIPQDWLSGQGETDGIKSITAFYPEGNSNSNVSIAITGIGPDFTKLESFGNADAFAENLVNGLDRSWKNPPGLAAKLIDSRAANGLYYIEYTLQSPGGRLRHLYSAGGMASNGWYNRLYTVTGQFIEDEPDKLKAQIQNSVSSFRLMK